MYKLYKNTEILVNYEPKMHYFTEWWKQLYGESEGKDQKGIFPAGVDFTTDLHSMGQYIQEGRRNLFETVISIENPKSDITINSDEDNLDGLNYLSGITERGVLMIKNRRIGHIGIATNDVARDVEWYVNVLGFEVTGKFQNGNDTVYFLKNDDVIFEIFPSDSRLPDEVSGRIDHYSFASDDIESDYAYCVKNGYKIVTDGIEGIAGFWDNGIRYFKIASPTGEQFEFCQIL